MKCSRIVGQAGENCQTCGQPIYAKPRGPRWLNVPLLTHVFPKGQKVLTVRLGHCTPVWGGHSPVCDRNGRFCSLPSYHEGPCRPHGQVA